MIFTNPQALWLLSLIPVVILIHSLKPKPRQVEITTLFLLEAAVNERGGGINIRKIIRNNLPLLLQILVILLAAGGLADPVREFREKVDADAIMIMDTTASMKTRTSAGNRFDTARQKALDLIDQLPSSGRMLIMEAGNTARVKAAFTSDKERLRRVVNAMAPADVPGDLEGAVYMGLSFARSEKKDQLYVITDRTGDTLNRITAFYPHTTPVIITGGSDNVGITRFEFRREPVMENRYQIYLEIKNFNAEPVDVPLRLTVDNSLLLQRAFPLEPGGSKRLILPYRGLVAGTARVTIERKDDLDADNKAIAVLSRSREIWVLLVSKGNHYLERLLAAYPNVKVNRIEQILPGSWEEVARQNDMVILDGMDFPAVERGNFLMLAAFSPSIPIRSKGHISRPAVVAWNKSHPLMRDLSFNGLAIHRAAWVQAGTEAVPLMSSDKTGLMYAYQKNQLKAVFLGFDPADSDLPYRVAFPVMMGNIIHWLYPDKLTSPASQTRAGDPLSIQLETWTENIKIRRPSGIWERHPTPENPFVYARTDEVGLYTLLENRKRYTFAVNLLNESESDIAASATASPAEVPTDIREGATILSKKPYWFFLLLVAAAALIAEWYVWLRRK